jgi:hypothetical protein
MATVALALYVVGIPILFGVLLFLHRKDIDKPQVNQWCVLAVTTRRALNGLHSNRGSTSRCEMNNVLVLVAG